MQQPDPPPVVTVKRADLHGEVAAVLDARLDDFERRLITWLVAAVVATAAITAASLWLFAFQRFALLHDARIPNTLPGAWMQKILAEERLPPGKWLRDSASDVVQCRPHDRP